MVDGWLRIEWKTENITEKPGYIYIHYITVYGQWEWGTQGTGNERMKNLDRRF